MADAYCGPSNALQNFQKHTSVDRTLQQDRLASRRLPLESFRTPEANAGILDPEFEAFQAGHPGALPFGQPATLPFYQSQNQLGKQSAFAASSTPNWANDFQRLQISSPAHRHAVQPVNARPSQIQSRDNITSKSSSRPYVPFQPRFAGQGPVWAPDYGQQQHAQMEGPTQQVVQQTDFDMFDDAAFERAFDAARTQMGLEQDAQEQDQSGVHEEEPIQEVDTPAANAAAAGLTPYPYLSVLRFYLASLIRGPSEENMHRAAVIMSLLEQHDPIYIDDTQRSLFRPILKVLADDPGPFAERYSLPARAQELLSVYGGSTLTNDDATAAYMPFVRPDQPMQSPASLQKPSAGTAEMLEDVEMQLDSLRDRELTSQVFDVISTYNPFVQADPQFAEDAQAALEIEKMVSHRAQGVHQQGGLTSQGMYDELFSDALHYSFSEETVQLRERLSAMQEADAKARLEAARIEIEETRRQRQVAEDARLRDLERDLLDDFMPQENPDDLARTAGELLHKVSDNTSDKFANSTFLTLMRRLRDGEVKVEGDKMVESSQATGSVLDGAKPDYVPPPIINQVRAVPPSLSTFGGDVAAQEARDGADVLSYIPDPAPGDVRSQEMRDGAAVSQLLSDPNDIDMGMNSPFAGQGN